MSEGGVCAVTRTYELMAIYRPELSDEEAEGAANGLAESLTESGAEDVTLDFWGRRHLAYEIDNAREGYYAVIVFRGEPGHVSVLDRNLSLADNVLRHKIIRPDDQGKPAVGAGAATEEEKMSQS